jgi:hypothetical protein
VVVRRERRSHGVVDDPFERPTLIGGSGSSGSTLLAVILDRHPQITCGPEMSLFNKRVLYGDYELVRARFRTWLRRGVSTDGYSALPRVLRMRQRDGLSEDLLCEMVDASRDLREFVIHLQRHCTERRGKRYFAEKTPSNVYCFGEFARLFPGCRLIHVIRDGRDVVCSLRKRGLSLFEGASMWLYNVAAGMASRHLPQYLEVRYEDLVTDPRQVVPGICEHIGVEYSDRMLEGREDHAEGAVRVKSWESSPADRISTRSVGRYVRDLSGADLACLYRTQLSDEGARRLGTRRYTAADLLEILGYGRAPEPVPDVPLGSVLYYSARDRIVRRLLYLSALEGMKPTLTRIA